MNYRLCILPALMLAMFTSCSPAQSEQNSKNGVFQFNVKDEEHIFWSELFNQKENHYLVFFYSDYCLHCHQIIEDVLIFSHQNILKIYFVDTKSQNTEVPLKINVDDTLGITDITDFAIVGTPTLVEIEKRILMQNVAGTEKCLSLLNELRIIL